MRKRTTKVLALIVCLFVITTGVLTACKPDKPEVPDTTPPVITLSGELSESVVLGRMVKLPAATASDDRDGDLTSSVKVTVNWLDDKGATKRQQPYQQPANKEQTFIPKDFPKYEVVYSVKDSAGNLAEKKTTLTAVEDTQAPAITITQEGFDIATGIVGTNTTGFVLPEAKGIDQPGDYDITPSIVATVFKGDTAVTAFNYDREAHYLIAGNYTITYTLKDGVNNSAESISFPLVVNQDDMTGRNLLTRESIVIGNDARFNEFGELEIGKTSITNDDNISTAAFRWAKISDGYVAVTIDVDPYISSGSDTFYEISFIGSKNADRYTASGMEGEWPPYLVLRMEASNSVMRSVTSGNGFTAGGDPTMSGVRDGQNHTLYFQYYKIGEQSTDSNARIGIKVWKDNKPNTTPDIDAYLYRSASNEENGGVEATAFDRIWNDPAGWLAFGAYSASKNSSGKFEDDIMRVKGIALYNDDETEFGTDITPPTINVDGDVAKIFTAGKNHNIPTATAIDGAQNLTDKIEVYLQNAQGEKTVINNYAFNIEAVGNYSLVYKVSDDAGNVGYKKYNIVIAQENLVAPVITLSDESTINVSVGDLFDLPTATAIDDVDGDISSQIQVRIEGPDYIPSVNINDLTTIELLAVGTYKVIYTVSDSSLNEGRKELTVVVSGSKTGNLVTGFRNGSSGTLVLAGDNNSSYTAQKVFDEKVSMVVNMTDNSGGRLLINLRGNVGTNGDWPSGMVMRFTGHTIDISAKGHDGYIFGRFADPFAAPYNKNSNVLVEYQTTNIIVDGVEYLRVRVWFNGKELIPASLAGTGLKYTDLVSGGEGSGLCVKVSDMPESANRYAGFIHIAAHSGHAVSIKEVRIDGAAVETPWESNAYTMPEIPQESAAKAFEGNSVEVKSGNASNGGDVRITTALAKANENNQGITLQTITFAAQATAKNNDGIDFSGHNVRFEILGDVPNVGNGIAISYERYTDGQNYFLLRNGNKPLAWADLSNSDTAAIVNAFANGDKIFVSYTITYIADGDNIDEIRINTAFGLEGADGAVDWKDYTWYYPESGASISSDGTTINIPSSSVDSANATLAKGLFVSIKGDNEGNDTANYYCTISDLNIAGQ